MSAESAIIQGRIAAEALMVDTCTIALPAGTATLPDGSTTTTYGPPVYVGKCKIQNQRLRYPALPEAAEHVFVTGPGEIHIPVSASGGVVNGAVVEILTSFNPNNVGRRMRVRIDDGKTFQTAMRLLVEEVVA